MLDHTAAERLAEGVWRQVRADLDRGSPGFHRLGRGQARPPSWERALGLRVASRRR